MEIMYRAMCISAVIDTSKRCIGKLSFELMTVRAQMPHNLTPLVTDYYNKSAEETVQKEKPNVQK